MSVSGLVELLGSPAMQTVLPAGVAELTYSSGRYRFGADLKLVEATVTASSFQIDGVVVSATFLEAYIRRRDQLVFGKSNFVISRHYGIAFCLDCPTSITCFSSEGLSLWLSA